ncbi:MAG: MFS transporter [Opitutaceae bacterium]|nr:MFS transporter [Opitutaceae bacterium]
MHRPDVARHARIVGKQRPMSLGVIFLTLYIDLVGFSIIFPLGPDLLGHYLAIEGEDGLPGGFARRLAAAARFFGNDSHLPVVLFGGLVSSVFAALQFVFAPFWGGLSDRRGRRGVLFFTVAGTAASYLLWVFSGSFRVFLLARVLGGAFGGNLSVATAAVADVTTRGERARAMGMVGAAFGLGLVTGPLLGALTARINLLDTWPALAAWGVHPFSAPALAAFALALVNFAWIGLRFRETLTDEARRRSAEPRLRNPLRAILALDNAPVRGVNLVAFVYALAFVAMETTLVFLSAERFGYRAWDNGLLMGFLGLCSILTQGLVVRRLYKRLRETTVLASGLACSTLGFLAVGGADAPWVLYAGVGLLALGGGLVNPSTTGLISLYAGAAEQGRVLGIYRSLGSLARAVTPIAAGVIFFTLSAHRLYLLAALLASCAWLLSRRLPQPEK